MFNRYIPQSDGSYRRNKVPDPSPKESACRPATPPPKSPAVCCDPPGRQDVVPCPPPPTAKTPYEKPTEHPKGHASGFLRQLLPPDFDAGDLIVVLLLLLLAGDCEEDRSTALLTLALYLFL